MGAFVDITGKKFFRLDVIGKTSVRDGSGSIRWDCHCECGNRLSVSGASLRNGNTRSCGCLKKERFTARTHGLSYEPVYAIWEAMIQRCYNPRNRKYADYGGRGIEVCKAWRHDPQAFISWAKENGYEHRVGRDKLTIDRTDNNSGYSPSNCRWVTYAVQNGNQRPRKKSQGA